MVKLKTMKLRSTPFPQASGEGSIPFTRSDTASLSANDSEAFLVSGQGFTASNDPKSLQSSNSLKLTGNAPECTDRAVAGGSTGGSPSGSLPVASDLIASLAMIERLPLSDEEKAEAVRRLLSTQQSRS